MSRFVQQVLLRYRLLELRSAIALTRSLWRACFAGFHGQCHILILPLNDQRCSTLTTYRNHLDNNSDSRSECWAYHWQAYPVHLELLLCLQDEQNRGKVWKGVPLLCSLGFFQMLDSPA